jgi:7,8-dihydroneopterin aldolase/epimerase/oxygenase
MDDLAAAFDPPHVRARHAAPDGQLDRISVRDYVRSVEVGAFAAERGLFQRLRFNVVLEVAHPAPAEADDVDRVISYDRITEAIEAALSVGRANLLETLAERVAELCLADARARRAFVRIEKLDRGPGALGVEIVRRRSEDALANDTTGPILAPTIVFVPSRILRGPTGTAWRDAVARAGQPLLLALEASEPQAPARTPTARRAGLIAIDHAAWSLAAADPRFLPVASRTEIDWAARGGLAAVWAPLKLVGDASAVPRADASDARALAIWLAAEIGARALVVGAPGPGAGVISLDEDRPGSLVDHL